MRNPFFGFFSQSIYRGIATGTELLKVIKERAFIHDIKLQILEQVDSRIYYKIAGNDDRCRKFIDDMEKEIVRRNG